MFRIPNMDLHAWSTELKLRLQFCCVTFLANNLLFIVKFVHENAAESTTLSRVSGHYHVITRLSFSICSLRYRTGHVKTRWGLMCAATRIILVTSHVNFLFHHEPKVTDLLIELYESALHWLQLQYLDSKL